MRKPRHFQHAAALVVLVQLCALSVPSNGEPDTMLMRIRDPQVIQPEDPDYSAAELDDDGGSGESPLWVHTWDRYRPVRSAGVGPSGVGGEETEIQELKKVFSVHDIKKLSFNPLNALGPQMLQVNFEVQFLARTQYPDAYGLRGRLTVSGSDKDDTTFLVETDIEGTLTMTSTMKPKHFFAKSCRRESDDNRDNYTPCGYFHHVDFFYPTVGEGGLLVKGQIQFRRADILPEDLAQKTLNFVARSCDNVPFQYTRIEEAKALAGRVRSDIPPRLRRAVVSLEPEPGSCQKPGIKDIISLDVRGASISMFAVWDGTCETSPACGPKIRGPRDDDCHPFYAYRSQNKSTLVSFISEYFTSPSYRYDPGSDHNEDIYVNLEMIFSADSDEHDDGPSPSKQLLTAEGLWDSNTEQLVMLACYVGSNISSNAGDRLDCRILVTFQRAGVRTIDHPYEMVGHVRSLREVCDPLFFEPFAIMGPSPHSAAVSKSHYIHSTSAFDRSEPFCDGTRSPLALNWANYPGKFDLDRMPPLKLFEMDSRGNSTIVLFINPTKSSKANHVTSCARRNQSRVDADKGIPSEYDVSSLKGLHQPRRILVNYEVLVGVHKGTQPSRDVHEFLGKKSSSNGGDEWLRAMSAEGRYDSRTGRACMVLCRKSARGLATSYEKKNVLLGTDCEISLQMQYPLTNSIRWVSPLKVAASVQSLRKSHDPLFFSPLHLVSENVDVLQGPRDQWRQRALTIISCVTVMCLVLVCFINHFSSCKKKKTLYESLLPKSRRLSYILLLMMFILILGHSISLILEVDSLQPDFQDHKMRGEKFSLPTRTGRVATFVLNGPTIKLQEEQDTAMLFRKDSELKHDSMPDGKEVFSVSASSIALLLELWWLVHLWRVRRAGSELACENENAKLVTRPSFFFALPLFLLAELIVQLGIGVLTLHDSWSSVSQSSSEMSAWYVERVYVDLVSHMCFVPLIMFHDLWSLKSNICMGPSLFLYMALALLRFSVQAGPGSGATELVSLEGSA